MGHRRGTVAVAVALALVGALAVAGCDMPSTGGLGQVGGSGNVVTRDYDFTGFSKIVVDSGFDVEVRYADTYQVQVHVDDNLIKEHLKVELDGDTLHIGLAPLWRYHDITTTARVTMPELVGQEASGASTVTFAGFASDAALNLEVSGASRVDTGGTSFGVVTVDVSGASRVEGDTRIQELSGDVSGGSTVRLAGSAGSLRLDVSGGSRLELPELKAENGDLTLSGGSNGQVTVTGSLRIEASGGSRLEYAGDPQTSIESSGGSAVEPY